MKLRSLLIFVAAMVSCTLMWTHYSSLSYKVWKFLLILEESNNTVKHPPPCGDVCFYGGTDRRGQIHEYTQLTKSVNCKNILKCMAWDKYTITYPPPSEPPPELVGEYTQNGQMPITVIHYLIGFNPNTTSSKQVYSQGMIEYLQKLDQQGQSISSYRLGGLLSRVIKEQSLLIKGKMGFVIGTQGPWIEAILLNAGARNVTTLEYANLILSHPQLTVTHPVLYAKKFLAGGIEPFDFGVSFSSLEHSGLGRYGDPLNPYGDLEAMAQAWCVTKPGGLFILGIPCTNNMTDPNGYIVWNAHRVYGPARLSQMTANWDLVASGKPTVDGHRILVLKRL